MNENWQEEVEKLCERVAKKKTILKIKSFQDEYGKKEVNCVVTRWLITKKLGWNREEVCEKLTMHQFIQNKLEGFIVREYHYNIWQALDEAFPEEKYLPWELNRVPGGFWNEERAIEALKWLVGKLKWTDRNICARWKLQKIAQVKPHGYKFFWLIKRYFNSDPFEALEAMYPGKFEKVGARIKLKK